MTVFFADERISDLSLRLSKIVRNNRVPDRSEIRALDFKGEFRRSAICSFSTTIDA